MRSDVFVYIFYLFFSILYFIDSGQTCMLHILYEFDTFLNGYTVFMMDSTDRQFWSIGKQKEKKKPFQPNFPLEQLWNPAKQL